MSANDEINDGAGPADPVAEALRLNRQILWAKEELAKLRDVCQHLRIPEWFSAELGRIRKELKPLTKHLP